MSAIRGLLPETLQALVPRYLTALPPCPLTGRPIPYEAICFRLDLPGIEKPEMGMDTSLWRIGRKK